MACFVEQMPFNLEVISFAYSEELYKHNLDFFSQLDLKNPPWNFLEGLCTLNRRNILGPLGLSGPTISIWCSMGPMGSLIGMAGKRSYCGKVKGCEKTGPRLSHVECYLVESCTICGVCQTQRCTQCPTWAACSACEKMLPSFLHPFILTSGELKLEGIPERLSMTGKVQIIDTCGERGMEGRRPEAAQPTTAHLCACQFLRLTSVSVLDHILGVPASFLESQTVCTVWKWIS